jgi:hypothetical protein
MPKRRVLFEVTDMVNLKLSRGVVFSLYWKEFSYFTINIKPKD